MDGAIRPGCPRVDNVIKKRPAAGLCVGTSTSAAEISTTGAIISTGVVQKFDTGAGTSTMQIMVTAIYYYGIKEKKKNMEFSTKSSDSK